MADNVAVTAGSGTSIASDDISSVQYQRIKLVSGGDGITPRDMMAGDYEAVAASATDQILGPSGAQYDFLAGLVIVPANLNPGAVSIKDGNGSAITVFTGGTGSVVTLHPFYVPLGMVCTASTTPGWKVTTGASVSVIGVGDFT
jgi:hypothetical protein